MDVVSMFHYFTFAMVCYMAVNDEKQMETPAPVEPAPCERGWWASMAKRSECH